VLKDVFLVLKKNIWYHCLLFHSPENTSIHLKVVFDCWKRRCGPISFFVGYLFHLVGFTQSILQAILLSWHLLLMTELVSVSMLYGPVGSWVVVRCSVAGDRLWYSTVRPICSSLIFKNYLRCFGLRGTKALGAVEEFCVRFDSGIRISNLVCVDLLIWRSVSCSFVNSCTSNRG